MNTKFFHFLFFVVGAVVFTSCLESSSNNTPHINCSRYFICSTGDTLTITFDGKDNVYCVDTVSVGDSISFVIGFDCFYNNLVTTQYEWEPTDLYVYSPIGKDVTEVLTPQSDTSRYYLRYNTGYAAVAFPVCVSPLKAGKSDLTFSVESDAEKVSNTSSVKFRFQAK